MTTDTSLMMELFKELTNEKRSLRNCKECPHAQYEKDGLKCYAPPSYIEECYIIQQYWE